MVNNWEESSTRESIAYLDEEFPIGEIIDLTLISDITGDLWVKQGELDRSFLCTASFLNKAEWMVVQWVDLNFDDGQKLADKFFSVQYGLRKKDPGK